MLNSSQDITDVCMDGVIKKKVTAKDLEKWEVALLDSKIEPCSSPSDLFEKLEKKRKCRHDELLQQWAKKVNDVNLETEKNISLSSTEVKAHIKNFEKKLKDILDDIDSDEITTYCNSFFIELQDKANIYKCEQEKLIKELYEDLMKFEDERAIKNEKILHWVCEEMRKIGYLLPYDIQEFVEHETLKMNQLSLNNRRCYEDVNLTLTLLTEQTFKSFMDKVYCIREKWIQRKLIDAFYNLQSDAEKKIADEVPKAYSRLEIQGQELTLKMLPDNLYNTCKAEEWMCNVEEALVSLDFHGQNLINIYKETMNAVYKGFNLEVETLKDQLTTAEYLNFEERIIQPIIFEAENDQKKELEELEIFWQKTLEGIRTHIKDVKEFLTDAGKVWQNHSERICESKKLILKALEKDKKSNQDFLQDLEIKLNLSLDALRQEHNLPKLQKAYEAATTLLNSIKSKYESMYLGEVSTIEDFYKMMDLEADVLSAEIKELIYETHMIDQTRIGHSFNDQVQLLAIGKPIVKEIMLVSGRIQAVKWWKKGVWLALETLSNKTRETLKPRAENWVRKKINLFAEQKSIQLELLDKRIQRIRSEIYEKRLEEIESHQKMFNQHKEKITLNLTNTKKDFQVFIDQQLNELDLIKKNLTEIEIHSKTENRPRVIRNNQKMLENQKVELEKDLRMAFGRFRAERNVQVSDLKQDNLKYMKSIKLFHEGGNYNTEEGKGFVTSLEVLDKKIDSDIKAVINSSTKEENEMIKKMSAVFNPLIALLGLLYEETQFIQETKQRLRVLTSDIQGLAKVLKLDYGQLNQQSYYLCMTLKSSNKIQDIDVKIWDSVIELLYKNISNLLFPVKVPSGPAESEVSQEETVLDELSTSHLCPCGDKLSVHLSLSKTFTFHTTDKDTYITCKNYKPEFFNFEKPPENNGTFMNVMCHIFWAGIDFLQNLACNFYKKVQGRKIIRTDLIPSNYDNYMSEILSKYRNYNTQVEQFWLQIILDFLPLFGRIKSLANYYLQEKLLKYENLSMQVVEDYEKDFLSCFKQQKTKNYQELDDLEKKLLPLYGYPHNENLLNELEEEVVKKTALQGVEWKALFRKFRSQLKCFRVHHVQEKQEIQKLNATFSKLRDTIFVYDLTDDILNILYDYCNKGELYIKGPTTSPSNIENSEEKTVEESLGIEMINKTRLSVQLYLNNLKKIIERERLPVAEFSKDPPSSEGSLRDLEDENLYRALTEPKIDVLLEIINFEDLVKKILNGLEKYIRRLKGFADSEEKAQEVDMFNWLKKWKLNVRKVLRLYRVKYEEKSDLWEEVVEVQSGFSRNYFFVKFYILFETKKIKKKRMAESENNKPKTEKTSDSVTSTLPRLCPTNNFYTKNTTCNIPKLKNRLQGSREILDEKPKHKGSEENSRGSLQNLKSTEFESSDIISAAEKVLFQNSFRNYHGQIPVRHRLFSNSQKMSPISTRSPSPLKKGLPKEKLNNKIKVITLDRDKKKTSVEGCRSSSPISNTKSKQRTSTSPTPRTFMTSEIKRTDTKRMMSTKINSKARKSKDKELVTLSKDLKNSNILKQSSQPSLSLNDKIQPQEKISLDHLKSEVYEGDHTRLSFEKVHLCIEKSLDNLAMKEQKSYFVSYSSENARSPEETSLSFLQNLSSTSITTYSTESDKKKPVTNPQSAIKTLSGNELILTPSMKIDIEEEDVKSEDLELSTILQETEENLDDQKEAVIPQDDANEYDSEVSTDGELIVKGLSIITSKVTGSKSSELYRQRCLWKSREAEMLSDVDYRQSVYHPAVSRRRKKENEKEFRGKNKSNKENFHTKSGSQSHSKNKFKNTPSKQTNERSWNSKYLKSDEKSMYNSVIPAGPFYGMKKVRTKRERISGALLHFTLKMIRLLAIFNLWPGDNCHMLTSQSLRLAS